MNKPEVPMDKKIMEETSEEPDSEREPVLIPDSGISGQKEFQIVSLTHERNKHRSEGSA